MQGRLQPIGLFIRQLLHACTNLKRGFLRRVGINFELRQILYIGANLARRAYFLLARKSVKN
jgi:hypothetical protein